MSNSNNDDYVNNALAQFAFKKAPKKGQASNQAASQPKPQDSKNNSKANKEAEKTSKRRKRQDDNNEDQESFGKQLKKNKSNQEGEDKNNNFLIHLDFGFGDKPAQKKKAPKAPNNKKTKNVTQSDEMFNVFEINGDAQDGTGEDLDVSEAPSNKKGKSKGKKKNKKDDKAAEAGPQDEFIIDDKESRSTSLKLPEWATEPNIRDKQGRALNDSDYDPTTLYIPPKALDKMGTLMKKYWEVKSQHYDKLVFIRLHKVYFVYHKDALICHNEMGCRLFNQFGYSLVYLHPPHINRYCEKLLNKDYKVILVEPTQEYDNKDEAKLEIYQIITKGTYIEPQPANFKSQYCLFLVERGLNLGFVYLDTTTHEYYMGELKDTPNKTQLRSLLLQITPVEIVYEHRMLSQEATSMLKTLYWQPVISTIPKTKPQGIESLLYKIKEYLKLGYEEEEIKKEENKVNNLLVLDSMIKMVQEHIEAVKKEGEELEEQNIPYYWTIQGINLSLEYLESLHLAHIVFNKSNFLFHNLKKEVRKNLILDGQTVYNLELTDVPYLSNDFGAVSLLKYMDKTSSPFGKRMFKKWLLEPLRDIDRIKERLDAVEELAEKEELCQMIQTKFAKIGDLERLVHNIYNVGNRKVFHELDFEAYFKSKILLFVEALKQLREADNMFQTLAEYTSNLRSKRLLQLLTYEDQNKVSKGFNKGYSIEGLFPRMGIVLDEMEAMMVIRNNIPMPAKGRDSAYDALMEKAEEIKKEFQIQLERTRKRFNCESITYVHIRHRYELEIPEYLVEGNKKPKEFIITSKKQGFVRFQNPEILELIHKLEEIEYEMNKAVLPFLLKCFKKFYSHNIGWQQIVSCFSELDCLSSLAQLARTMGLACRPSFEEPKGGNQVFELKGIVHPCLAIKSKNFVRNNVMLEEERKIFLITGPNMGGKSTLMRTVCIATIMAQMGSFVPAESFRLTPIDRIFTRIGAQDSLMERKSTFFIELEETLNIVTEATENSLVIVDELGRGTSTYDGMAIAYAVLKYLAENVECLTFFATHFHLLLEEFKIFNNIGMYYMESEFSGNDVVEFLYRFQKGSISNSFGLSVAKMAGLPQDVIEKAREKANFMTKEQLNIHNNQKVSSNFMRIIESLLESESNGWNSEVFLNKIKHIKG